VLLQLVQVQELEQVKRQEQVQVQRQVILNFLILPLLS
jgi:hypothetical protein